MMLSPFLFLLTHALPVGIFCFLARKQNKKTTGKCDGYTRMLQINTPLEWEIIEEYCCSHKTKAVKMVLGWESVGK